MADRTGIYTTARGDAMQQRSGRPFWPMDPRAEDVVIDDVAYSLARVNRFGGHTTSRPYPVLEHLVRCCDLSLFLDGFSFSEPEPQALLATHETSSQNAQNASSPRWVTLTSHTKSLYNLATSPTSPTSKASAASDLRSRPFQVVIRRALQALNHDDAESVVADVTRPLKVNLPDYQAADARNEAVFLQATMGRELLPSRHRGHALGPLPPGLYLSREVAEHQRQRAEYDAYWSKRPGPACAIDAPASAASPVDDPRPARSPDAPPPCTCGLSIAVCIQREDDRHTKLVDNYMLSAERRALMRSEADGGLAWGPLPEPPPCAATDLTAQCFYLDPISRDDQRAITLASRAAAVARTAFLHASATVGLNLHPNDPNPHAETPPAPPTLSPLLDVARLELAYFAAVEEERAVRLRLAWHRRLNLLLSLKTIYPSM